MIPTPTTFGKTTEGGTNRKHMGNGRLDNRSGYKIPEVCMLKLCPDFWGADYPPE